MMDCSSASSAAVPALPPANHALSESSCSLSTRRQSGITLDGVHFCLGDGIDRQHTDPAHRHALVFEQAAAICASMMPASF
jgi:hypothetical protein